MPTAPAPLARVLVGAVLLAGCSGPAGPDGGSDGAGQPDGGPFEAHLPAWAVGDAWTYTFNGEPTTYVVASETGTEWILETDSAERSFADQRDDISRLGPQRKSDLAGSQGDDRVEFFRWPLAEGMPDWTTRWDHQDVRVHVVSAKAGSVELEARLANATASDPPLYTYVYDDTVGWFRELVRHAPDGSEMVRLELAAATHGWTGTLVRWDLAPLVAIRGTAAPSLTQVEPDLQVPAGATDLWLSYSITCPGANGGAGYTMAVAARPPGVGSWNESTQCAGTRAMAAPIVQAPAAGAWSFTFILGGGPQAPTFDVTLLARTRQDVPFP